MSKQDIEKRLGFAAQGVKETTRTSAKATMAMASDIPDTAAFKEKIRKYAATDYKKDVDKEDWKDSEKAIRDDVKKLQSVLMHVSLGERNRAVQLVDNMDTFVSDVIPRNIYNWIYKGYSARPVAKAKMATPAESEQQKLMLKKGIASINKSISASEANLRDDIKRANWSNAVGGCQALSSLYLRLKEMYAEWNKLARSTEYARPGAKAKA